MYDPKVVKELDLKRFRKNGLVTRRDLHKVLAWEEENQRSSWLTTCLKGSCGRAVVTEKVDGLYRQRCIDCGHVIILSEIEGKNILPF